MTIDGEVTGDVVSVVGGLTLGPHAVVRGDVTAVGGPFKRDPQAQVFGKVNEVGIGANGQTIPPYRINPRDILFGTFASRVGTLTTTIARVLMFMLFLLIVTAVGPTARAADRRAHRGRTAARGTRRPARGDPVRAVLVLTIIGLVISIIGIPLLILVPFGIVLVGVVMLVGFTGAAHIAGGWVLDRFGRTERNPYLVVATGLIVIAGVTLLGRLFALAVGGFGAPLYVAGYLIEYLAWTVGFGAAILAWLQTRRGRLRRRWSRPLLSLERPKKIPNPKSQVPNPNA